MSAWADFQTAGFRSARQVFGVDFTVAGDSTTYRGVMRDTAEMLPLQSGGMPQDYDGALDTLKDDVDPNVGTKLTINGITYRIEHKQGSEDDPVQTLFYTGIQK